MENVGFSKGELDLVIRSILYAVSQTEESAGEIDAFGIPDLTFEEKLYYADMVDALAEKLRVLYNETPANKYYEITTLTY